MATTFENYSNKAINQAAIRRLRRELLNVIQQEKARHWKMRGTHRLGKHFERGFFRGLNHAYDIVNQITKLAATGKAA
jgi:hypothetical protein